MKRGIKQNTFPGEIFKEEILAARNLSLSEASDLLKVPEGILLKIVTGEGSITQDMAVRIAEVFGAVRNYG